MKLQTRLYFQKTGILMAVYLVLRFLLPIVLPFFLAWMTVGCLTFFQKRSHMKLMSLSVLYLVLFLLLSGASVFCGCWLLYEPCCRSAGITGRSSPDILHGSPAPCPVFLQI